MSKEFIDLLIGFEIFHSTENGKKNLQKKYDVTKTSELRLCYLKEYYGDGVKELWNKVRYKYMDKCAGDIEKCELCHLYTKDKSCWMVFLEDLSRYAK